MSINMQWLQAPITRAYAQGCVRARAPLNTQLLIQLILKGRSTASAQEQRKNVGF